MIKRFPLENILGIAPISRTLKKKSKVMHFKKKHIQNIRKQEKNRIKQKIFERVNSWIKKEQTSLSFESLKYYLRCLKEHSDQNGYSFNEDLLLPTGKLFLILLSICKQ